MRYIHPPASLVCEGSAMIRFGLQIPNFTYAVPDGGLFEHVAGLARAAEESGYDSVWAMDHLYQLPALGGPDRPMLECYALLSALGARTSRVKLGALVGGVTYRNPALLAKIVTTLDVITSGRAVLGLGAAWYDVEHEGLGFDFPPAGERLDRLEEAVQICRAMFTQEAPSFDGRHYRIHEARNIPRPIQPGGPRIMVGGGGEKRTLKIAARHADLCNFFGDVETTRHKISVLRKHCADAGRDASEVTVSRLATMILSEDAEQAANARQMLAQAAGTRAAAGFHVGTADEILAQVAELAEAGVEYFIFNMPASDEAAVRRAGTLLTSHFGAGA
jgi:F420-dependent oxidoreductase-like protein